MQHLNMPHLRGRVGSNEEAKSNERMTRRKSSKGRPTKCRGSETNEPKPAKGKGKAKEEDESTTADSDKSNHMKAKRTKRQPRTMPRWESQQVEGRRSHKGMEKVIEGLWSRQVDRAGRGA